MFASKVIQKVYSRASQLWANDIWGQIITPLFWKACSLCTVWHSSIPDVCSLDSCDNEKKISRCWQLLETKLPPGSVICFHRCFNIYRVFFFRLLETSQISKFILDGTWFLYSWYWRVLSPFASSNTGNDYFLLHKFCHHPLNFKKQWLCQFHNSFIW